MQNQHKAVTERSHSEENSWVDTGAITPSSTQRSSRTSFARATSAPSQNKKYPSKPRFFYKRHPVVPQECLNPLVEIKPDNTTEAIAKGWLSPKTARSLYVTLAFLVEAYTERAPGYRKQNENSDGKDVIDFKHFKEGEALKVLTIATSIARRIAEADPDGNLEAQSDQSIMTRIEQARKFKNEAIGGKLKGRK